MQTNIKSLCVSFVLVSTLLFSPNIQAQLLNQEDQIEKTNSYWEKVTNNVFTEYNLSEMDFETFFRFDDKQINAIESDFYEKVRQANSDITQIDNCIKDAELSMSGLYKAFIEIRKNYPSSVAEFSHPQYTPVNPCDSSGCTNVNFSEGTLNSWYGYYANHSSSCSPNTINSITGGLLGPVKRACGDPLVVSYYGARTLPTDTQISITSSGYDAIVHTIPRVSPWASGGHSVMLGDSTWCGFGVAILEKTFLVSPSNSSITYQYAVLLNNPLHCSGEQPVFTIAVLNSVGDTISSCGKYNVVSGYGIKGFDSTTYEGGKVYYRDWTIVNVPLKHYVGQCVTLVFEVQDCGAGGHFGYAYVDASCSPLGILASSPNFCGQDSITLTGPPGDSGYVWRGPLGKNYTGIRNHDSTTQTVSIDSSGIYRLITIPVTGASCADTLYDTIGKLIGHHPKPSFTADTVCVGTPMTFINTSIVHDSGIFSWDFYNLGIYNYNDIPYKDTTWTYSAPGVYTVKLHDLLDGCGYDTLIKVQVDTAVGTPSFTASPLCIGDSTFFTATAAHATKYDWHFGDPASGVHDSSKRAHPGHMFTSAGTYTVTIKAINAGNCDAVDSFPVTVLATPNPVITGPDSVCVGGTITLNVTGGTTYEWLPSGSTTTSINVTGSTTQTITVQAANGSCSGNASFVLTVVPAPTAFIRWSKDSVCSGDSLTLEGGTGLRYRWSPGGQTTAAIHVRPITTTTYTLYSTSSSCVDSITKTIPIIPAITGSIRSTVDSICPLQPATITASSIGGQGTYVWAPGGQTTASITVSPSTTTVYTATITGLCNTVTETYTITFVPLPVPVIVGTPWKCKGVRDTLTVSNSNGPATYIWSNGKTTTSITTGAIDADSVVSVTAYNKLGCPHDTTFNITLRYPLTITVPPPAVFCAGTQVCISAGISGSPISPVSYNWSPGGATTDTICVSPTDTTDYVVTVSNGCKSSKSTLLTPNYPNLNACCNQTITSVNDTVTPSFVILGAGGNSIKYSWADSNNVVCLNPPLCDSVKVTPTVTTTYIVTGTDANGCSTSQLITITVDIPCFNLTIPNVFTPTNGGTLGLDKVFYIDTKNMNGWSITIFDRWGKQMFNSTDPYKYWGGTTESGGDAPAGVYYYIITGTCQNTTYKKDGYLQLIR